MVVPQTSLYQKMYEALSSRPIPCVAEHPSYISTYQYYLCPHYRYVSKRLCYQKPYHSCSNRIYHVGQVVHKDVFHSSVKQFAMGTLSVGSMHLEDRCLYLYLSFPHCLI